MAELETKRLKSFAGLSIGLILLGVAGFAVSFAMGSPAWGIVVTDLLFFASITQGALAIAVVLRITQARWSGHFYRLAAAIGLAFFPVGLALIAVTFLGRTDIFFWLAEPGHNIWQNSFFFIVRNLVPFFVFYLLARRLLRIARSVGGSHVSSHDDSVTAAHDDSGPAFNNELLVNGFLLLLAFVIYETILSWDYSMLFNKHFADTAYSVIFIIGSILGGVATLVLAMAFAKRFLGSKAFGDEQFRSMSQIMLAISFFWFYVWYTQFFNIWFVNLPEETEPIYLRMFHGYGPIFFASLILIAVIPFFVLLFKKTRESTPVITGVAASILLGLFFDRYTIVIPALVKEGAISAISILNPINIVFTAGVFGAVFLGFARIVLKNPQVIPIEPEEVAADPLITQVEGWQ